MDNHQGTKYHWNYSGVDLDMKQLLEQIVRNLVDHPDLVSVEQEEIRQNIVMRLKVGQEDVGKVIGRRGHTAHSLRILLTAIAAKHGKRAILEIAS
jgi:uncharacterized protein